MNSFFSRQKLKKLIFQRQHISHLSFVDFVLKPITNFQYFSLKQRNRQNELTFQWLTFFFFLKTKLSLINLSFNFALLFFDFFFNFLVRAKTMPEMCTQFPQMRWQGTKSKCTSTSTLRAFLLSCKMWNKLRPYLESQICLYKEWTDFLTRFFCTEFTEKTTTKNRESQLKGKTF